MGVWGLGLGFGVVGFEVSGFRVPGFRVSGLGVSGFRISGFVVSEFGVLRFGVSGFGVSGFGVSGFGVSGFGVWGFRVRRHQKRVDNLVQKRPPACRGVRYLIRRNLPCPYGIACCRAYGFMFRCTVPFAQPAEVCGMSML